MVDQSPPVRALQRPFHRGGSMETIAAARWKTLRPFDGKHRDCSWMFGQRLTCLYSTQCTTNMPFGDNNLANFCKKTCVCTRTKYTWRKNWSPRAFPNLRICEQTIVTSEDMKIHNKFTRCQCIHKASHLVRILGWRNDKRAFMASIGRNALIRHVILTRWHNLPHTANEPYRAASFLFVWSSIQGRQDLGCQDLAT